MFNINNKDDWLHPALHDLTFATVQNTSES